MQEYEVEIMYRIYRKGEKKHRESGWSERRPITPVTLAPAILHVQEQIDRTFPLPTEEVKPPYDPANTGDRVIRISFTGEVTAVLPVVEGKTEEEVIELMSWAIPDEAWMGSLQESEVEIGTLDEHNWVVPDPEEDTDGS